MKLLIVLTALTDIMYFHQFSPVLARIKGQLTIFKHSFKIWIFVVFDGLSGRKDMEILQKK